MTNSALLGLALQNEENLRSDDVLSDSDIAIVSSPIARDIEQSFNFMATPLRDLTMLPQKRLQLELEFDQWP